MLSTMVSTASIILSLLFSFGKGNTHRRFENAAYNTYAAPDQYFAEKRMDASDAHIADGITRDFTTEYANLPTL